ncbi:hypothetical protein Q1695_000728 [Nippostrongylus brasiliensis]|nr:hypothetical protein Q1695_000728 [Nippostrongylus brasiliensis]
MSLFWERAVSSSPTQQNVDNSGLEGMAGVQEAHASGHWDSINLGNVPPQQQNYNWSQQHIVTAANANREATSGYVDPYSAAVMGGYQQGAQNVVYPYQQRTSSSENYMQPIPAQGNSSAQHVGVDQNYYYQPQQQNSQSQPYHNFNYQHHEQQQLQQQQQQLPQQQQQQQHHRVKPTNAHASHHVHHTLVPSRAHGQQGSHHTRTAEQQQQQPNVTPTTTSYTTEVQSVPLAVITPAVAQPSFAIPHPQQPQAQLNPLTTVQPFNSRSTPTQAEQVQNTAGVVVPQEVGRTPVEEEASSRRPSLSYLAVQPVLSVQSSPAVPPAGSGAVAQGGDSAQVTPESSYSVDTFGSGISSAAENVDQQQTVVPSSAGVQVHPTVTRNEDVWEDDWERTEHPERDGAREVTPSDVASQTQSEPPGCASSYTDTPCTTREGSMAPHADAETTVIHRSEISADTVRVAPVSATPTAVIGVPRYEESCRPQDHVPAVAQVAPLRPEPESIQSPIVPVSASPVAIAQSDPLSGGVTEHQADMVHAPPLSQSPRHSLPSPAAIDGASIHPMMADDANASVSIHFPFESVGQPSSLPSEAVPSAPPPTANSNGPLSPIVARATSTPVERTNETTRTQDIRPKDGWEPNNGRRLPQSATNPNIATSAADHSDSTTGSLSNRNAPERRSVQSRYKKFKEHFSGIMGRLDQYRSEPTRTEFRSSSRTGNPLMAGVTNSLSQLGRRSVLAAAKNNPSQVRSIDGGNVVYPQGDPTLDQSYSNCVDVYGDDFIEVARRARRARLSRPNSRARSEFGSGVPGEHDQFDSRVYPQVPPSVPYGAYPSGRRSVHSSMGVSHPQEYYVQQAHLYKDGRRPRSSFDQRAMERFQHAGGRYGQYDVYDDVRSSGSEESDSDNAERGDSEEEIRKYTQKGRFTGPGETFDSMAVGEEMYYFGAIHLDQARVRAILANFPPPMEYHRLPPIEKAAYLFFVAVYKKQYSDIGDFHRKFNREYYKYTCDGDTDNVALWKICKSMQEEYHSKRLAESQKAYEASQRQLFSDDRDSVDGMSDRASMDENHDDRTSDILSIDSSQRAPLKHRVPHAFVSFGPGGKMVTVHPDLSVSVVQIDDIKSMVTDPYSVRLIDGAQTFKGPLLIGQTPTHSVRLYIERQIKRIMSGDLAAENPHDNDVIDCLLIWQLLGVIVQQQGRVTGPDIARLLVEVGGGITPSRGSSMTHQTHHGHREKSVTPADSITTAIGPMRNQAIMDARAYERFTELLLGGHIVEAIDSALRDGLYADAMVLARRLLAHDVAKLAEIEERFLATRPQCNPVVTLVSVSSKKLVPILMNPTGEDGGSWRTHAAIILANLTSPEAMETVYDLAKVLAKREYNCAADFCFLAVSVLAGINPFKPIEATPGDGEARQHITLIHACLPDDDGTSDRCRYGFSLTDLHATEIFDYAVRLSDANAYSPLGDSIEYQRRRIQYAHLISEFGGFATDAFKYCMEVARAVWNYYHLLSTTELTELCDLADRLRYAASASDWETAWIGGMRSMILQKQQTQVNAEPQPEAVGNQAAPASATLSSHQQEPQTSLQPETQNVSQEVSAQPEDLPENRSRSGSLTSEARDWHAQRQDPLQMSPVSPRMSAEENDVQAHQRSRTVSNASQQHGYPHDSQAKHANDMYAYPPQMPPYGGSHVGAQMEDPSSNSEDTSAQSTAESTPIRTMNRHAEQPAMLQSTPDYQRMPQPPVPNAPKQTQPERHTPQPQVNGLPDSNMKKSNSTQGKGFFGVVKEKIMKAIPSGNEMILPDDSKPTIVWDPVKGRYVGTGVEEETTSAPPPKLDGMTQAPSSSGGLRAARTSGGSRYFNPLNQASTNGATTPPPSAPVPVMQVPATFGFIPSMPDDAEESVDPFSGQANPTVHGAEMTAQ